MTTCSHGSWHLPDLLGGWEHSPSISSPFRAQENLVCFCSSPLVTLQDAVCNPMKFLNSPKGLCFGRYFRKMGRLFLFSSQPNGSLEVLSPAGLAAKGARVRGVKREQGSPRTEKDMSLFVKMLTIYLCVRSMHN